MNEKYTAGVDEAGRGCVLGPMVIGICKISEDQISYFRKIGVKDSKLLSFKKREELFEVIKKECKEYRIIVIPAQEINVLMQEYTLNEIETQKFSDLINHLKLPVSNIIIDAPEKNTEKFKLKLFKYIDDNKKEKIIAENKADLNHIVVGCASILAKVTRDRLLYNLVKCKISGYPADVKTIKFIKNYIFDNIDINII